MFGIEFRSKYENISDIIKKNNGIVAVYGIAYAQPLMRQEDFYIDYFVDKNAEQLDGKIEGKPIVTKEQLEKLIINSRKRATIIICASYSPSVVLHRIYEDLGKLNIEADVFDYFDNAHIFAEKSFVYKGKSYLFFEHSYNCFYHNMRMTERSVELRLADEWINSISEDIVEIGGVTPYYHKYDKISEIVDPTDLHRAITKKKSLFDIELKNKNVLSISTVEHIGTNDYGMNEVNTSVDAIEKILGNAKRYFITFPYGYNLILDNWVNSNRDLVSILVRNVNNKWHELNYYEPIETEYLNNMYANGLVILEN